MRKYLLFLVLLPTLLLAQTGGKTTYQVLQFPVSSRMSVLNNPIAIWGSDLNLGIYNPALLNPKMKDGLALNFVDYFSDINMVSAAYAFPFKDAGTVGVSIQSLSLGKFTYTNEQAEELGFFRANEQLLTTGFGKQLHDKWSIGGAVKFLFSDLESYQSFGMATDLGATYLNRESQFAASVLAQNIGRQITSYNGTNEPLSFEVKLGLSKKLEHLPFRFSIGYNHLETWDLTYHYNPTVTTDPITGEKVVNSASFGQKLFRHFTTSGELSIGKYLQLRMGYDAQRRHELTVNSFLGMVGFSWGIGIKVSHFYINYGRASYHLAGAPNYFSLNTNLSKFYKRQ
ncbi:MAG: hypothetical protein CMP75_02045 [Flavobacteriales bacterium]|nr:hypothetical protein [Flavobacteriales bacterium]